MSSQDIKTCNELNRVIIKEGSSNDLLALRSYYLLKHIDDGSGHLTIEQATRILPMFLGKSYTLAVLSRMPASNAFWTLTDNGVYLKSWESVWNSFDVHAPYWTLIPAKSFFSRKRFKAHAYSAFVNGRMISRENLSNLWGFTRQTQYAYERLLGITVEARGVFITEEQANDLCALNEVNPAALTETEGGFTRQVSNHYRSISKSFTSRLIKAYNSKRSNNLHKTDDQSVERNTAAILWLTETHMNRFGKPSAKKYDGTKTLAPNGQRLNGLSIMAPVGTYLYV